jgi:hypothetical protein
MAETCALARLQAPDIIDAILLACNIFFCDWTAAKTRSHCIYCRRNGAIAASTGSHRLSADSAADLGCCVSLRSACCYAALCSISVSVCASYQLVLCRRSAFVWAEGCLCVQLRFEAQLLATFRKPLKICECCLAAVGCTKMGLRLFACHSTMRSAVCTSGQAAQHTQHAQLATEMK